MSRLADGTPRAERLHSYLFDCDGYQVAHPPAGLAAVDPRLAEIAEASAKRAQAAAEIDGYVDFVYSAYSGE